MDIFISIGVLVLIALLIYWLMKKAKLPENTLSRENTPSRMENTNPDNISHDRGLSYPHPPRPSKSEPDPTHQVGRQTMTMKQEVREQQQLNGGKSLEDQTQQRIARYQEAQQPQQKRQSSQQQMKRRK